MSKSKTKQTYTWIYLLFILGVFYLCFFKMERTEIGDIDIVRVLGIDYRDNKFVLTALFNQNGGADTASEGIRVIDGTGTTVYEAYENLKRKNKRNVSIAHTTYYIVSDQTARSGLLKCMDFIARDQTVKMNAMIYVMLTEDINLFIKDSVNQELFIHDDLAAIKEKQMDQQKRVDNTISQVLNELKNPYSNLLLPYLAYQEGALFINGYAVFREDTLYSYMDYETSLAIDLFRERLRTCPLYLNNSTAVEIMDYDVTKTAKIVNGELYIQIAVDFASDIKEANEAEEVYQGYQLEQWNREQNAYVQKILEHIVLQAKTNQLDLLGIGYEVRNQLSRDWETLHNNWEYHFNNTLYDYKITSRIGKNYIVG